MRLTMLLPVWAILRALPATAALQEGTAPRPDRVGKLVQEHLGDGATVCGRFKYLFIRGSKPTRAETASLRSCMADAYAQGRSFFFSIEGSGVDSYVATGLMRAGSRRLERFWYDSAPCGTPMDPACPERFRVAACPEPARPDLIDPFLECLVK
jgi:hypothetical protein